MSKGGTRMTLTQKRCKSAAPGSVYMLGTPRGRSDACADA
jgi:hypothetical protein